MLLPNPSKLRQITLHRLTDSQVSPPIPAQNQLILLRQPHNQPISPRTLQNSVPIIMPINNQLHPPTTQTLYTNTNKQKWQTGRVLNANVLIIRKSQIPK